MGALSHCVVMAQAPYPIRRNGLTLRYYPLLKSLVDLGVDLELVIITASKVPDDSLIALRAAGIKVQCYDAIPIAQTSLSEKLVFNLAAWTLWGKPHSLVNYHQKSLEAFVKETCDFSAYDSITVVGPNLYEVVAGLPESKLPSKICCDFVDSMALHFQRRFEQKPFLKNWIEKKKAKSWESKLRTRIDTSIFISPADVAATEGDARAIVLPNGIEVSEYENAKAAELDGVAIGFVGDMNYEPNHQACMWFVKNVWPKLESRYCQAIFYIVGRNPRTELVDECSAYERVRVLGEVDNIWSYYKAFSIFVCPLFLGSGQQNKVLEAMYSELPVITTDQGNSGVLGEHEQDLLIANNDEEFLKSVASLVKKSELAAELGKRAKEYVSSHYKWDSIARRYIRKCVVYLN